MKQPVFTFPRYEGVISGRGYKGEPVESVTGTPHLETEVARFGRSDL